MSNVFLNKNNINSASATIKGMKYGVTSVKWQRGSPDPAFSHNASIQHQFMDNFPLCEKSKKSNRKTCILGK